MVSVPVSTPTVVEPPFETSTVTVDESSGLPALSVARARIVYVPFVGWPFQVTEYGAVVSVPSDVLPAKVHDQPEQ